MPPVDWTQVALAAVNRLPQIITAVFSGIAAISGIWGWRHSKRARRVSEDSKRALAEMRVEFNGKMTAMLEAQKQAGRYEGMRAAHEETKELVTATIQATKEPLEGK